MKNLKLLLFILLIILLNNDILKAQDIPDRPSPPRLVNDFAGMLGSQETELLESKLVSFNDSTSTQIAIVTVRSLGGYEIMDYSQRLGEKWGIGQKKLDNGILILVKPKTPESGGEISITTGYGLEGRIPDLTCDQIITNEILPAFREGNYYQGLDAATSTLMSLARGEFSAEQYGKKINKNSGQMPTGMVIFIIIIVIMIIAGKSSGSNNRHLRGSGNLPLWLLLSMLNSGGSHRGSWGGFSGGSGGGGFGGFGGGSFGGGGSHGSW